MRAYSMFASVLAAALTAGTLAGLPRPAMADQGDISVGGVWVSKITQDASGYSANQRVAEVNKRITEVLSRPELRRTGAAVAVRQAKESAIILVGDQLVMTVTPEDTAGTQVSTVELARQWAQRLAQGLSKAFPDANFHTF
jgi:hypothetical protein